MPRLSIITINYNNTVGLAKTIESVITQTSTDYEYIVIDGGSRDGSLDIIKKYEKSLSYWVSEPDRGIYHAMNKGIRQATGDYCQFLNSGDYLLASEVTERMLTDMPSDCSIVYGNEIRDIGNKRVVKKSYAGRPITFLDLYRGTIFHGSAYIKRSLFDKYGLYDESFKIVSDWKFYLVAVGLQNEQVAYCNIDLVWFDNTGISTLNQALDQYERAAVLKQELPQRILADYERFATDSIILGRLKANRFTWFLVVNLYRVLFWTDKLFA
ncbi:glycosyltransferase (plasmid) [Spirosoma oryzicola]|nr:glycosyltransferase family 2 protein [Spirosoma oryzicola]UHG94035.1 glycosyltransferase [Spirosoma oryzicola]